MASTNKMGKPWLAWSKHQFKTDLGVLIRQDQFRRCNETNAHGRVCGLIPSDPIHRFYPCRKFGCQEKFTSIERRLMHEDRCRVNGGALW